MRFHEHMGCLVWALDFGKPVTESHKQVGEFGTKTERMYENWDKILTKKSCRIVRKLGHTKTEV